MGIMEEVRESGGMVKGDVGREQARPGDARSALERLLCMRLGDGAKASTGTAGPDALSVLLAAGGRPEGARPTSTSGPETLMALLGVGKGRQQTGGDDARGGGVADARETTGKPVQTETFRRPVGADGVRLVDVIKRTLARNKIGR